MIYKVLRAQCRPDWIWDQTFPLELRGSDLRPAVDGLIIISHTASSNAIFFFAPRSRLLCRRIVNHLVYLIKWNAFYDENRFVNFAMTVKKKLVTARIVMAVKSFLLCNATTEMMKPIERTITTKGSTLRPGDSSVYSPVPHISTHPSDHLHSGMV